MFGVLLILQTVVFVWSKNGCDTPVLPIHLLPFYQVVTKSYPENAKFYYKCADGYKFVESDLDVEFYKTVCVKGKWDPDPVSLVQCIDNCKNSCGQYGTCVTSLDNKPFCECKQNYFGIRCNQRVCDALPFMETPTNGKFVVRHGSGVNGKYAIGTTLEFICNLGFETTEPRQYSCSRNGWSHQTLPICQRIKCPLPHDINRKLIYTPILTNYDQGYTVSFSCLSHHEVVGVTSVLCGYNGEWSSSWPTCKSLKCPQPPSISDAYYELKDYYLDDFVRYTCLPGYIMVSNDILTCNSQLQWYGSPKPTCYAIGEFQKTCDRLGKEMMLSSPGHFICAVKRDSKDTTPRAYLSKDPPSTKSLTIVTGTAGGLLLLLLMIISFVACQRRRSSRLNQHYRHRRISRNDDRYSFVYYSNDVHVVLPSYDEAMQNQRQPQPPPYLSQQANIGAVTAVVANENEHNTEAVDSVYECIDDILPPSNNNESASSQRHSSITSTPGEPLYASIQRVLSGASQCATSREESASIITLNSQAETSSISTAYSHEDNASANNVYTPEENSSTASFTDEAYEENQSISSAELCEDDAENALLINKK